MTNKWLVFSEIVLHQKKITQSSEFQHDLIPLKKKQFLRCNTCDLKKFGGKHVNAVFFVAFSYVNRFNYIFP